MLFVNFIVTWFCVMGESVLSWVKVFSEESLRCACYGQKLGTL